MPQIKGGPKELNRLLENVYQSCMKTKNNKTVCSKEAWAAAKRSGWSQGKDGKWVKKILNVFKGLFNGRFQKSKFCR